MFAAKLAALFIAVAVACAAHVGSPDVYTEGQAGPYSVLVAVHTPPVIPGVAQVEVEVLSGQVDSMEVVPLPLVGPGKDNPPIPDRAARSRQDPAHFTASVWLMAFGSYQVRMDFAGAQGKGRYSVPVPALAVSVSGMQRKTGWILFALMVFLVAGLVSIAGAAVRDAGLDAWANPPAARQRKAWRVMAWAAVFCIVVLWLGNRWWISKDNAYRNNVYKPLTLTASLDGSRLKLQLADPGWLKLRKLDDLVPDHGHLMHLFLIRLPGLDRMAHLHPDMLGEGRFSTNLPPLEAGEYQVYADIAHQNGLAETAGTRISIPTVAGAQTQEDDSFASAPILRPENQTRSFPLETGVRMTWQAPAGAIQTRRATQFRFAVVGPDGKPAGDLEPYMGMAGHAEFIRSDAQVFAHVHPAGSAPMAAMMLAQPPGRSMAMNMEEERMPGEIMFPYGIPSPGLYRVFVQVKRHGAVQTGVFDFTAADPLPAGGSR